MSDGRNTKPAPGASANPTGSTDRMVVWIDAAEAGGPLGAPMLPLPPALFAPGSGGEGAAVAEPLYEITPGAWVLRLPHDLQAADLALLTAEWAGRSDVARVEPDWRVQALVEPDDPRYLEQWHYQEVSGTNYGANLPPAWDVTTGTAEPVVAIIDTGVVPHADLVERLLPGYDFIVDVSISNDGDGRDPDASDPGDACNGDPSSWHGTHVAGTVGASTDNGTGVAGVNWNASLLPVRVLGTCGGYSSDVAAGMIWAAGGTVPGVPSNSTPARVLNLSLGRDGVGCSFLMQDAVDSARARGALVVAAAGNGNQDAGTGSVASCDGVLAVANTTQTGDRQWSSNYGDVVELAAPGTEVLSTSNDGVVAPGADTYVGMSGTSMAAPHVAGIASLVLSVDPTATADEVTDLLVRTATPFPAGSGCTAICGSGIVNAGAALAALTTPPVDASINPGVVTDVVVVEATGTTATVRWTPTSDGLPAVSYTVLAMTRSGSTVQGVDVDAPGTSAVVTGLVPGEVYWFSVMARSGPGGLSSSEQSDPAVPPFVDVPSFVDRQYVSFTGEPPAADDRAGWIARLSSGEASGNTLIAELSEGPAWSPFVDPVTRLYLAGLGRTPDTGGLVHWQRELRSGAGLEQVAAAIGRSPEFRNRYGTVTDGDFVDAIYHQVFGRTVDGAGRSFWLDELADGASRTRVLLRLAESPEHRARRVEAVAGVNIRLALLGRAPTADEVPTPGLSTGRIASAVLGSAEYDTVG